MSLREYFEKYLEEQKKKELIGIYVGKAKDFKYENIIIKNN